MTRDREVHAEPELVPATEAHVRELMSWFCDAESCALWGGPAFRFPFTEATFREDARWGEMPALALVDPGGALLAFGQFYLRAGRCQLARLAVSPARRRQGLGARLVRGLAEEGCRRLTVEECSLFVAAANEPAVRLYRRLGFVEAPLPAGETAFEGAAYMIVPLATITASEG